MFSSMREHQVLARLGLALAGAEHVAARVHGRVHAAGNAVQLRIELLLQAAQPVVVHAHIAQHLRGNFVVRIKALELFLEVDALEALILDQLPDAGSGIRRDAPRNPGKAAPGFQTAGNLLLGGLRVVGVGVHDRGQCAGGRLLVVDFGGHGKDGVHLHGHGQLAQVAVIEHAAARSHLKGALLLLVGALHKLLVAHHLEPEEAQDNQNGPKQKKQAYKPEARQLHRHGARCSVAVPAGSNRGRHGQSLRELERALASSFQRLCSLLHPACK